MNHLTKLSFAKAAIGLDADTALMGASLMPGFVGAGASLVNAGRSAMHGDVIEAAGHALTAPLAFFGGGIAGGTIRSGLRALSKSAPSFAAMGRGLLRPAIGQRTGVAKLLKNPGTQLAGGLGIGGVASSGQGMVNDAKQFNLDKQRWSSGFSNFMEGRRGEMPDPVHTGATGNPNLYT